MPVAHVKCKGNKLYGAYWGRVRVNQACDYTGVPQSDISNTLKNLSEVNNYTTSIQIAEPEGIL